MEQLRKHILDGTPADILARYESLAKIAEQADFGVLDHNVVVLDTETTGLSFSRDELIQIAAARIERGTIVDWYVTFVNPGQFLSDDIIQLTHIKDEDLIGAPLPDEALEKLADFVGDALVIAHNASFDKHFCTKHPGGYPLLDNRWIDSLDLSRIALPRLRSHRLLDLVRAFDAPASTHRADDDVAATCIVYRILLAAVALMPPSLVAAIGAMAPEGEWTTGFVFSEMAKWQEKEGYCDGPAGEQGDEGHFTKREDAAFSLYALRKRRVITLPSRPARKDADELAGKLNFPTREEIDRAFSFDGMLGGMYDDYEPRREQRDMAQSIRDTFALSQNLAVEAGTGVGKSMAYLVPSALFARANDVTVGVATKTNSLLDQLVFKELPALSQALQQEFGSDAALTWAPLKGMGHYPCLRKIQRIVDNSPSFREVAGKQVSQAPSLAAVVSYIEQSEFDDLDACKADYRALPKQAITCKSSECLRRKCPYYGKLCFVHGARRRAEMADIIVTNHSLLFCDLATDGGLLPVVRHWIVDEAHSTEAEARDAFALSLDSESIGHIAERVAESAGGRNLFTRVEREIEKVQGEQLVVLFGLLGKAREAGASFARVAQDYLHRVKDLLYFDPVGRNKRGSSYEQVEVWINADVRRTQVFCDVAGCVSELIEASDRLIKTSSDVVAFLEDINEAAVAQRELASCTMELRDLRNAAELIFQLVPENYAYQATLLKKKDRLSDCVSALLLDVGEKMNETLYARTHSVVYASATLTVGGKFDAFSNAVGLNGGEFSQAQYLALDSCFDFDNNMIVYVVSDMPEPTEPSYLTALNRLLTSTHLAQRGSMLTLFTNRREMERCYEEVSPELKREGLRLVCQRYGVSVKGLRDDFLSDEHLSLFALKTFWEGFDAPGATLKGVIIPKLPFGRPTDPLYCERASRDDRAWWHYVLPQAVIETKQAAGRLIRKHDDHGVLILADKRLISKRYGKTFLSSLQSKTVRVRTIDEIVRALEMMADW